MINHVTPFDDWGGGGGGSFGGRKICVEKGVKINKKK